MILNQLRLLLGSFLTLCLTHFTTAQCLIPLTLEDRVSSSEVIISGKIIGEESFWQDAEHRNIATACKVEVFRIFKGENVRDTLEIIIGGGKMGNKIQTVQPSPQFKLGDFAVLMCAPLPKKILTERPNCYYLTANVQSVIDCNLETEIATDASAIFPNFTERLFPKLEKLIGQPSVILKAGLLSIKRPNTVASLRAKPIVRQILPEKFGNTEEGFVEIKGSGFGTERGKGGVLYLGYFFYVYPLFGVDTVSKNIAFWSDTLIRVPRASIFGDIYGVRNNLGDTSSFDVKGALNNKYLRTISDSCTRLANVNDKGGYTIVYGTDCADGEIDFSTHPARWAFEAALGDWVKQTNFNVRVANPLDTKTPTNNICRVRFDSDGKSLQDYLGGALATCASTTTICQSGLPVLDNFEIVFQRPDGKNSANKIFWDYCTIVQAAQTGGNRTFSLRTVALHELGHALGFDHIFEQKRIMNANATNTITGLLYDDDLEGARYIRQKSDQLTCKKPMNNDVIVPKVRAGCGETEPIDLFDGKYDSAKIVLRIRLFAATNATNIQVERSLNNRCFDSIGLISARNLGTSLFTFTDKNIPRRNNTWYYRLRFTLPDGSFTYSLIATVRVTIVEKELSVAPNPFGDRLSIQLDSVYVTAIEAWFYDLSGRLIGQQKIEPNTTTLLELDTKFLMEGMYIVHLRRARDIIYKGKVCKM
jgi:Matrixin